MTKQEQFYEDVQALIEANDVNFMEIMQTFFTIILALEIILEDGEGED